MEKLSLILIFIGLSVFVFSLWTLISIKRHLSKLKNNYKFGSSFTDERYFELKSKQEYIIAISAVIFSIISFIGYTSIENIKKDMSERMQTEINRLDTLHKYGKTYEDSVRGAFKILNNLKRNMQSLSAKDVINQNIFIVDPLRLNNFPYLNNNKDKSGIRVIKFENLETITGNKLPKFKAPPSVVCFSSSGLTPLYISNVTGEGFHISIPQVQYLVTEESKSYAEEKDIKFSIWISQKPSKKRGFDEGFSDDFE